VTVVLGVQDPARYAVITQEDVNTPQIRSTTWMTLFGRASGSTGRQGLASMGMILVLLSACGAPSSDTALDTGTREVVATSGVLVGLVTDSAGTALSGVHITTMPRGYEGTTTDDGTWRIERLPPDDYEVVVAGAGWETIIVGPTGVAAGDETELDAALTASEPLGGELTLQVHGPDGEALVGAVVTADGGGDTVTDSDGIAVLSGLGGETVSVTVTDADGALWSRSLAVWVPDEGSIEAELTLSGRPPADATYVGSTGCVMCHPDATAHQGTAHAEALSEQLGAPLDEVFQSGVTVMMGLGQARAVLGWDTSGAFATLTDDSGATQRVEVTGHLGAVRGLVVPLTEVGDQAWTLPLAWRAADPRRAGDSDSGETLFAYHPEWWFDATGAFDLGGGDTPAPEHSADANCLPCHTTGWDLAERSDGGVDLTALGNGEGKWVEAGVQCERCHGPGSTHSSVTVSEKIFHITQPQHLDPAAGRAVCGQCHSQRQGEGNGLPFPYSTTAGAFRPGQLLDETSYSVAELWASGAAALPRQQHDELLLSPHGTEEAGSLVCWDCHDAHGATLGDDGEVLGRQLRLDPYDNTLCLSCHLGLTFGGDTDRAEEHDGHALYEPEAEDGAGRCIACHMPATSTGSTWSAESGAGDMSSHLWTWRPPQDALDVFAAEGATELGVGSFPIHGCADCHAFVDRSFGFSPGPTGDPTLEATHQSFQDAVDVKFP